MTYLERKRKKTNSQDQDGRTGLLMNRSEGDGEPWTQIKEHKVEMVLFGHVTQRNENSILRRVMELEVEGRRAVGRPKKTWSKVVEEDMKLNIMKDMAENRKQWKQLILPPTVGVGN